MIGNRYEYDVMAKCERELWWYKCLHKLIFNSIIHYNCSKNISILDAGCGTGGVLLYLQNKGYFNLKAFDLSNDAVEYATSKTNLPIINCNIEDLNNFYSEKEFDFVLSIDTLCYFETNQLEIVSKLLSVVKNGGYLILNVPALKAFSGTHDHAVGIRKRYSKKIIKNIIRSLNGVELVELKYWPFILSPIIFFVRFLQRIKNRIWGMSQVIKSDIKLPNSTINSLFTFLTNLENKIIKSKPWGSSLFVVIKKKETNN